jgi:hypothetical protein
VCYVCIFQGGGGDVCCACVVFLCVMLKQLHAEFKALEALGVCWCVCMCMCEEGARESGCWVWGGGGGLRVLVLALVVCVVHQLACGHF